MFDSVDKQEIKNICDYIINDVDQNDMLFEDLPEVKQIFEVKDKRVKRLFERINKKVPNTIAKKRATKIASKKSIDRIKKARYLQTDNDKTVDYNHNIEIDDLSTVGYDSDTEITVPSKTSVAQQ